ncbi:MAG TPA: hypothetical protein VJK08_02385 [Patescibacteria group bacterium]|nr:hypothetical protein [Patescibacteria group bacterium]
MQKNKYEKIGDCLKLARSQTIGNLPDLSIKVYQNKMNLYKTKKGKIAGTSFSEVCKDARRIYNLVRARTKRTPYVRSKYFRGEKIFITLFWSHLFEKSDRDRVRRLRYFECALDLIRNSAVDPESRENFKQRNEILHRFNGITDKQEKFVVQIKENKRSKRKDLISIYPLD